MVQFGKRFVSGHRFSDAGKGDNSERLSPPGLARHSTAAKSLRLYLRLAAGLKPCPDTSLSFKLHDYLYAIAGSLLASAHLESLVPHFPGQRQEAFPL
jgi:hypothetical protein